MSLPTRQSSPSRVFRRIDTESTPWPLVASRLLWNGPPGTILCCLLLFAVNAAVCSRLWFAGYIDQLGSTEGPFLAFSSWIAHHWSDLRWFPLWFSGMPFERVYGPGLHATVAAFSTASHLSILQS